MKKMIFGGLIFFGGLLGVIALVVMAALSPWSYNGIGGLWGALLGTGTMSAFILFSVMGLAGLVICIYEAYVRK
ncbi:MAG: hypothetical protein ACOCG5_04400 [Candidatus Alkaliphilus sp. MAG34]